MSSYEDLSDFLLCMQWWNQLKASKFVVATHHLNRVVETESRMVISIIDDKSKMRFPSYSHQPIVRSKDYIRWKPPSEKIEIKKTGRLNTYKPEKSIKHSRKMSSIKPELDAAVPGVYSYIESQFSSVIIQEIKWINAQHLTWHFWTTFYAAYVKFQNHCCSSFHRSQYSGFLSLLQQYSGLLLSETNVNAFWLGESMIFLLAQLF